MKNTLTVKQAIEQGYTHCGYNNRDYQSLMEIKELNSNDWDSYPMETIVVADTSPVTYSISGGEIVDFITDKISDQDEINDENEYMIKYLDEYKELEADLDVIADKINSFIGKHKVYSLTDIELINETISA